MWWPFKCSCCSSSPFLPPTPSLTPPPNLTYCVGMSFEPECRPFDYPEAPWNQCCPPGFQRKPSQLQTVLPSASPATASSSSSACCCRPPARAPLVAYGGALFPWFPAGVAIAVPPETATPSTEEERPDKAYIEAFMERCTSPNGPPPTDDVIKMIRSWCGTE